MLDEAHKPITSREKLIQVHGSAQNYPRGNQSGGFEVFIDRPKGRRKEEEDNGNLSVYAYYLHSVEQRGLPPFPRHVHVISTNGALPALCHTCRLSLSLSLVVLL